MGSRKQASDYDITAEFVVNHIRNKFDRGNNVSEGLRTMAKADTDVWQPMLKISPDTDANTKYREDKQSVTE